MMKSVNDFLDEVSKKSIFLNQSYKTNNEFWSSVASVGQMWPNNYGDSWKVSLFAYANNKNVSMEVLKIRQVYIGPREFMYL